MDVNTITSKVKRAIGDTGAVMVTDSDIWGWIDEAQMEIVRDSGFLTAQTTAAANTFPVTVPATWMRTVRVTYDGNPLTYLTQEDIDSLLIDVSEFRDTPSSYYHIANANQQLALYPLQNANDTKSVVWTYVKVPTTIASGATPLDVTVSNHVDILNYCLFRGYTRMGKEQAAKYHFDLYATRLAQRQIDGQLSDETYPVIRDDPRDFL